MDLRRQTNCLFRNLIFHVHSERRSYYTALLCLFFPAGRATPRPGTAVRCQAPDNRRSYKALDGLSLLKPE